MVQVTYKVLSAVCGWLGDGPVCLAQFDGSLLIAGFRIRTFDSDAAEWARTVSARALCRALRRLHGSTVVVEPTPTGVAVFDPFHPANRINLRKATNEH